MLYSAAAILMDQIIFALMTSLKLHFKNTSQRNLQPSKYLSLKLKMDFFSSVILLYFITLAHPDTHTAPEPAFF